LSKFIVFSDLHLHSFDDFSKQVTYDFYGKNITTTDRVVDQIKTIDKVFDLAEDNEADIIFCGDFFHSRGRVATQIFNIGFKSIYENMKMHPKVNLYMLVGNHDQKDATRLPEHSLEAFKAIDRVVVLDEPTTYLDVSEGVRICALPYSDDIEFLKEKIKEFTEVVKDESWYNLLIGHIGVDGSEVGRYSHRLEGAFSVGDLHPDKFDYICLGHYHKRQFLGGTDNTFYVGNTIQQSFSDEGQDKGVFLLDLENIGYGKPEFIPIDNKKFITLTEVNENTQDIVDNNYVRFVLPQDKAQEVETFKEESDNIRVEIQKEYKSETRIDIGVGSNEEQIVSAYADEYYPKSKQKAIDILKEAMTT